MAVLSLVGSLVPVSVGPASASITPAGFTDSAVLTGLVNPTIVRFATDGRVFVGEKSGLIKVFENLSDPTPDVFADLRTNVHNFWDRGLLGLALAPGFPTDPSVYVLYTYDAAIGGTAPRWGTAGVSSDPCPTPPGATADGCVVSGRLSRLTASGNQTTGPEQVLIEDWCQQYPSHTVGSLQFGSDGALYVSGGDGASFQFVDYGQDGNPLNPCGDPPGGVGAALSPPTAEGGALRSQDLRTVSDPTTLDGAILRLDPATGAAMPDNPLAGSSDLNARRIVAYGNRNPFRLAIRPGTSEVWFGDVGWNTYEEINQIQDPKAAVLNFGWPCYEGGSSDSVRQSGYDGANLTVCENLYLAGVARAPYFAYNHNEQVIAGETCTTGSSSISGIAFYQGGNYPPQYDGTMFFSDYSRNCIWAIPAGANGLPDPAARANFVSSAEHPVHLEIGPGGDLFYVDFIGGTIRRVSFTSGNQAPTAVAAADPTSGPAPLNVEFDGTGSSDPDNDTLVYAWDLDGDGALDDSTSPTPSWTYATPATYTVQLRVTDPSGAFDTDTLPITVSSSQGNVPPTATIQTPTASTTWAVGDAIAFAGAGDDPEDGTLPASALSWSLVMQHCPSTCHAHPIQDFVGVGSGSFTAPDHEYPSHLELTLTVTDSGGLNDSDTINLDPQTADLSFGTVPSGLALVVGSTSSTAPFTRTVIVGSTNTISATSPQVVGNTSYQFASWSDGGAQAHEIVAGETTATYTATFNAGVPARPDFNRDGFDDLVVGTPGETIGSLAGAGAVHILYGSPPGLSGAGSPLWTQDSPGVLDIAEAGDNLGTAVAWGDFNNDGFDDLAMGAPGESVGTLNAAGAVHLLYGSASGLTSAGNTIWTQNTAAVQDVAEANDRFGAALARGDFNGDGLDDLAIGAPGESTGTVTGNGLVHTLYGAAGGLTATGNQLWTQDTSGVQEVAESGDAFGSTLVTGDFNGDGRDELAVGARGDGVGAASSAGAVNVLLGSAAGLTATGNQLWTQDIAGVQEVAEANDRFGSALAAGDTNGDGRDELAIGAPGDSVGTIAGAGVVNLLFGSASGLSSTANQLWTQDTSGILDTAEAGDALGGAVHLADVNGDSRADLVIGAPGESTSLTAVGIVHVVIAGAGGPAAAGNQVWSQDTAAIADIAETNDRFGSGLGSGDFNKDGRADLIVSSPAESVVSVANAGALNALYGSASGLVSTGNQLWTQDSAGVQDVAEANDSFGAGLPAP